MLQLTIENFRPNSYILVEGTPARDHFYIIQSGKVRCFHETKIRGVDANTYGPGDFVGVVSCMSGHAQTESVVATTAVSAIKIRRDQYQDLIVNNAPVAIKIVRAFSRDMRLFNETHARLTRSGMPSNTNSAEHLYEMANYYEDSGLTDIACFAYYQYIKACPTGANAKAAQRSFDILKRKSKAVYLEPNGDMVREYPKDTMIFAEGQAGNDMFIVQGGAIRISKVVNGEELTIDLAKRGDMIGEMALLENKPRSANAIAHEACKLMVVNRQNFDQMVTTQPQYILKLTTILAERLWYVYRRLINSQLEGVRAKLVDMLAVQMEAKRVSGDNMGRPFQTELRPQDLIGLCGISDHDQPEALKVLSTTQNVKVEYNKVVVTDVEEMFKLATFYRKQHEKKAAT